MRRAKRNPDESVSNVAPQGHWENTLPNARQVVEDLTALCARHPEVVLSPRTLAALDRRRRTVRRRSA